MSIVQLESRHLLSACDAYYERLLVLYHHMPLNCDFEPPVPIAADTAYGVHATIAPIRITGNPDESWHVSIGVNVAVIPDLTQPSVQKNCFFDIQGDIDADDTTSAVPVKGNWNLKGHGDNGEGLRFGRIMNPIEFPSITIQQTFRTGESAESAIHQLSFAAVISVTPLLCTGVNAPSTISIEAKPSDIVINGVHPTAVAQLNFTATANNPNVNVQMATQETLDAIIAGVVAAYNRYVSRSEL